MENIDVKLTVEVGSAELKIRELLRLNEGSVIELDRLAGDPLDILINGTMIAKGEVVMVGERFGIRFVEIVDPLTVSSFQDFYLQRIFLRRNLSSLLNFPC